MKKIILSGFVIIVFGAYAVYERSLLKQNTIIPLSTSSSSNSSPQPTQSVSPITYRDGSYTGSVADAFYGNIQIKAVIFSGKISDVLFLQYPNDRSESVEINQQAMPPLREEAIQVQNSQVDIVSGATQTSEAFRQSLQSALEQAKG